MGRLHIPEPTLRALLERHPFYEIARFYRCHSRDVGALAARYGLSSAFVAKAATEEEIARLQTMAADGWSVKRIAKELGRSQDFVARRVHAAPVEASDDEIDDIDLDPEFSLVDWPLPTTTPEAAMAGRRYEDVSEETVCREWPPWRLPLNGAALASAAQAAARSTSRSSADLCADGA